MTAIAAHAAAPAAASSTNNTTAAARNDTADEATSDAGGFAALFTQLVNTNSDTETQTNSVEEDNGDRLTNTDEKDALLEKLTEALADELALPNNDNKTPNSPANNWATLLTQQQGALMNAPTPPLAPALLRELLPANTSKTDEQSSTARDLTALLGDDLSVPANFAALALETATRMADSSHGEYQATSGFTLAQMTSQTGTAVETSSLSETTNASSTNKPALSTENTRNFNTALTEESNNSTNSTLTSALNHLSTGENINNSTTTTLAHGLTQPTPLAVKAEVTPPAQLHIPIPVAQQQRWQDAFNQKVVWITGNQVQSAELQLNPLGLGPVEVHLDLQQDQANLVFLSSHQNVRDVIQAALPKLQEMLNNQGITMGNVHVGAETTGQSFGQSFTQQEQGQAGQQQSQGQHQRQQHDGTPEGLHDNGTVSHRTSYLQDSGNTVDLFA